MTNSRNKRYQRTMDELEELASMYWPEELSEQEANLSVIPLLLETQEKFLQIIGFETRDLDDFFDIVEKSTLPANVFLKHLVILADFGGEQLKRASNQFYTLFPQKKLNYYWQDKLCSYKFKALPKEKLSNPSLMIDGRSLTEEYTLNDLMKDAIAILLFGNAYSLVAEDEKVASALAKCQIGDYLGKPKELAEFVKQRYIWVSRITGGAQANSLGQLAQEFVRDYITENLGVFGVEVQPNGRLPNVTHTDVTTGRMTAFDMVVTNTFKYAAVEVGFQVTTNSVIERKGGQARSRIEQVEKAGHKIAYVIDGAGNFERRTAVSNICSHSHCTVAFSSSELDILCDFLREYFEE